MYIYNVTGRKLKKKNIIFVSSNDIRIYFESFMSKIIFFTERDL